MSEAIILAPALEWSGALRRKLTGDPEFSAWLARAAAKPVARATVNAWFDALAGMSRSTDGGRVLPRDQLIRVLRRLRERVFFTLMARDLQGSAPFLEVASAMSTLADLAVMQSYRTIMHELASRHGVPRDPDTGAPQELLIVGMGKLGGRELNVSSDIDLVMLYAHEGTTAGPRPISHHEFYARVVRGMIPLLSDHDVGGFVFRCDLRLRPDGSAGALAWSLAAFEKYLLAQGREWERYAWIKARVLPGKAFADSHPAPHVHRLEALRIPFVYRKYLDYGALAALRDLRQRIRRDWERRAQARSDLDKTHNIKLGDGGIREIEFIAQLNQLIRGGQLPSLQQRGLRAALHKQQRAGVLPATVAQELEAAYLFLRRVEHMLQYREDEQTHMLPRDASVRADLAKAMGMAPDAFEESLKQHRDYVSAAFRDAFSIAGLHKVASTAETAPQVIAPGPEPGSDDDAIQDAPPLSFALDNVRQQVQQLVDHPRMQALSAASRQRLDRLLPLIVRVSAQRPEPAMTARRLLDLVEHIAPRSTYLALLSEYPVTLERLARMVDASPWAASYLRQYPLVLDSLIEWNTLMTPPNFAELASRLSSELDACRLPDGAPDVEQQMNLMRDLQHKVTFQLLAQDLSDVLTVEQLADDLSALADLMLEETIRRVWPLVQATPPAGAGGDDPLPPPRFAVIAYGKLGGKELGYASDLDLVFLYDDPHEQASERYARLVRRVSSWLSTLTSSGRLYEVDLRLRPDGDAGLLAVTVSAFEQYQTRHAWTWEHQAITRARFAAGDPAIGARFEAVRQNVLLQERDPARLREDVITMRRRIRDGHPNRSTQFDIKHDAGGMVDVEFIVQYLVLGHAREHRELLGNLGNIALLRLAAHAGLIPDTLATRVADAYRTFRRRQHALRLQGADKARVAPPQLAAERDAVRELWKHVFGD